MIQVGTQRPNYSLLKAIGEQTAENGTVLLKRGRTWPWSTNSACIGTLPPMAILISYSALEVHYQPWTNLGVTQMTLFPR